jgi:hypothetical protein
MVLFEQKATEEEVYYVWKGQKATSKQRPMYPWYGHVGQLGELKSKGDALFEVRFRAANKFFQKKDSSHANIYRHYHEVSRW